MRDALPRDVTGLELWIGASTPWGLVIQTLYTAGQAGITQFSVVVHTPAGARAIPLDAPSFCAAWDDAPDDEACTLPHAHVEGGRVAWFAVPGTVRHTRERPDERGEPALLRLLGGPRDCMLLSIRQDRAPAPPLASPDQLTSPCPVSQLSAGETTPWKEVAPTFSTLRARGEVWIAAESAGVE